MVLGCEEKDENIVLNSLSFRRILLKKSLIMI